MPHLAAEIPVIPIYDRQHLYPHTSGSTAGCTCLPHVVARQHAIFVIHDVNRTSCMLGDSKKTENFPMLQAQAVGEAAGAAAIHQNASDLDLEHTKTVARRFLAEQANVANELHISAGILCR